MEEGAGGGGWGAEGGVPQEVETTDGGVGLRGESLRRGGNSSGFEYEK